MKSGPGPQPPPPLLDLVHQNVVFLLHKVPLEPQ